MRARIAHTVTHLLLLVGPALTGTVVTATAVTVCVRNAAFSLSTNTAALLLLLLLLGGS